MSEVIATSLPAMEFNKVDFPTFDAPIIATVKPWRIYDAITDRSSTAIIELAVASTIDRTSM